MTGIPEQLFDKDGNEYVVCGSEYAGPPKSLVFLVRPKPKKKVIDMTQLGEGALISTTDTVIRTVGAYSKKYHAYKISELELAVGVTQYWGKDHPSWPNFPVPEGFNVELMTYGDTSTHESEGLRVVDYSNHSGCPMAFKVIGLQDDYRYAGDE